jgi:hypothetical protein
MTSSRIASILMSQRLQQKVVTTSATTATPITKPITMLFSRSTTSMSSSKSSSTSLSLLLLRRSSTVIRQYSSSSGGMVGNFGDHPKQSAFKVVTGFLRNNLKMLLGGTVVGSIVGQYYFGHTDNFYDYRFVTDADPADLQDFYGSENFMDIYCVMPFMGTLMMRGGTFDDEGVVHTTGFPGEMQVSMVFSDSEEEVDDDDDGSSVSGGPPLAIATDASHDGQWFNKRERFKDVFLGMTMWDMVTNFGFETLPDGRTMVYHHGEYFKGNIPPISLLVRLVFSIHAR